MTGASAAQAMKEVDAQASREADAAQSADPPGPGGPGDGELVRRARSGDGQAFEALVRRHLRVAHGLALRLVENPADADDVCQDAFIRALEHLDQCQEPERFRAWFLTIVRNRASNLRKYERVRVAQPIDALPIAGRSSPEKDQERVELRTRLRKALEELTPLQREIVLLHDYEGWKHSEIAEKVGISGGASRFNLHAARKKLRVLLDDAR